MRTNSEVIEIGLCPLLYHLNFLNVTISVLYPGQHGCHHDIQCSVTYAASKCSAGQCVCPDGFSAIEQTCKPGFDYD